MSQTIVVAQRMWQRRDTAANWTSKNPVLAAGEIGVELPEGESTRAQFKIGTGSLPWNDLPYAGGIGGNTDDLPEGAVNLYFTPERAREAAPLSELVAGENVSIDVSDPKRPVISAGGGGGGGIPDAPADGTLYGRKDGQWAEIAEAPQRELCVYFNGVDQWGDVASMPSDVIASARDRTVVAIFRPGGGYGTAATRQVLFAGKGLGAPQFRIGATQNESGLTYYEEVGSMTRGGLDGVPLLEGEWTVGAGRFSSAGLTEVMVAAHPWGDSGIGQDLLPSAQWMGPFSVARRDVGGAPDRYFRGALHSLGVFPRLLTTSEVLSIFVEQDLQAVPGLVSGWRFGTIGQLSVPNLVPGQPSCELRGQPGYILAAL